jgi:Domain of unknown function (DUF6379)
MAEGMLRADALTVRDGQLAVAVHLPWYRSLPISCLESVDVRVDDTPAAVRSVAIPGFTGAITDAGTSEAAWDLRDPLDVSLDAAGQTGDTHQLEVAVAIRIPYIQQAPGVPLVQRTVVRTEGTVQ